MNGRARLSYVVPSVGSSPHLQDCLAALSRGESAPILLAAPAEADLGGLDTQSRIHRIEVDKSAGFTGACNRSLAAFDSEYVAIVNDDAVVDSRWATELLQLLESDPDLAAVQGTNVQLADPSRIDGCGIGWNKDWQAVQLRSGEPLSAMEGVNEIFGASGTAVLLRRQALELAALAPGSFFEPLLGTYYEDVELACRLRGRGFRAAHLPTVSVRHAGAVSSATQPIWRWHQVHGNRLLVLARLWGRSFPAHLPRILARDIRDLTRALFTFRWERGLAVLAGWGRAIRHMSAFAHRADPLVTDVELRGFQVSGCEGPGRE